MSLVKGYNGTYYIRYISNCTGKWTQRSLHTKELEEAKRNKEVFIRDHRDEMKEYQGVTLQRLREKFGEYHIKQKAKKTISNYKIVFDGLERLLGKDYPIKNIITIDIEKYKNKLVENGLSNYTINSYLRNVKCIFNKGMNKFKYLKENPAKEVEFLDEPEMLRAFTEYEVNFLAENIDNELILNTFLFGVYSGCRRGELLNIQWKDIDLKNKTINVVNNRIFKTKTRKYRQIPISDELFYIIKDIQYKQFGDIESNVINLQNYLFANPEGKPYDGGYISRQFKKYLRAFGFDEQYNFHSTRYSFATQSARNGVSIDEIRRIMGHTRISTTLNYIKVPTKEMHEAVNRNHIESIRKRYMNSKIYKRVIEMYNQ